MNVLITGASRGIGQTIANLFLDKGHAVWIPTREELDLSKPVDLKNRQFDRNFHIMKLKSTCPFT